MEHCEQSIGEILTMKCEIAEANIDVANASSFEHGLEIGFENVIQFLRSKDCELPLGHYRYAWEWANFLKDRKDEILKGQK